VPLYLAQMKRKCFSFALGRTQDKRKSNLTEPLEP
jgi:hypothetical protein